MPTLTPETYSTRPLPGNLPRTNKKHCGHPCNRSVSNRTIPLCIPVREWTWQYPFPARGVPPTRGDVPDRSNPDSFSSSNRQSSDGRGPDASRWNIYDVVAEEPGSSLHYTCPHPLPDG